MLSKEEIKRDVYEVFDAIGIIWEENQRSNIEEEMDSLQFISLICDLEDKYGIIFSDEEILIQNYGGIESFVELVSDKILSLNN